MILAVHRCVPFLDPVGWMQDALIKRTDTIARAQPWAVSTQVIYKDAQEKRGKRVENL